MSESSLPGGTSSALDNRGLAQQLEILSLKLDKQALESSAKAPAPKRWWATLIEFLVLPSAVLAIVLQITQTTGSFQTQEKTVVETEKLRTEEMKTRVELQGLLDTLAEKKQKGVQAYRDEIEKTLPQLQATVERLRTLETQSSRPLLESALAKFVILWVLFHAVGLAFDVITQVWSTLLSGTAIAVFNRRQKTGDTPRSRERQERIRKFTTWAVAILQPVPSILRWSIQLSIFIALMIPLFNEVAEMLGSSLTFENVLESAKTLSIGEAIGRVGTILYGSTGS